MCDLPFSSWQGHPAVMHRQVPQDGTCMRKPHERKGVLASGLIPHTMFPYNVNF